MNLPFDRGSRTYHIDDERLAAFRALSCEDKLRWQEEIAQFIRLTRQSREVCAPGKREFKPDSAGKPTTPVK
jgi:hypothetical protein